MTVIGEAFVVVRPDTKGFGSAVESEGGSQLTNAFRKIASVASVALAGVGLEKVIGGFVDAGREANRMADQTRAALASTGGAAKVSFDDINNLADSLSHLTGIDDTAIINNENLLLTFTSIRNEVGKGNDIFTQATKATLDMSKALGEDGKAASIQLGKALNDPIAGATALRRVGIQLTSAQQDQIKAFVKAGDVLSAQKVILGEVNKEFGGSAQAQATAADRLSATWQHMQEQLGQKLIPVIDKAAIFLSSVLPKALDATFAAFDAVGGAISDFVQGFVSGTDEIGSSQSVFARWGDVVFFAFQSVKNVAVPAFQAIRDAVAPVIIAIRDQLAPIFERFSGLLEAMAAGGGLALLIAGLTTLAGIIVGPIITGLIGLVGVLTSPIFLIGALAAGVVYAYTQFQTFHDVVDTIGRGLQSFVGIIADAASAFSDRFGPAISDALSSLTDFVVFFTDRFSRIKDAIENVLKGVAVVIAAALAPAIFVWQHFNDQIVAIVSFAWNVVTDIISTAFRVLGDIFDTIVNLLTGNWGDAWKSFADIPKAALDQTIALLGDFITLLKDFFSSLPGNLLDAGSALFDLFVSIGGKVMSGLLSGLEAGLGIVADFFKSLPGRILTGVGALGTLLVSLGRDLLQGLLDGAEAGGAAALAFFVGLPGQIIAAIPGVGDALRSIGLSLLTGLGVGATAGAASVLDFFKKLPDTIISAVGDATTWLADTGKNIITGLINGLVTADLALGKFFLDLPGHILDLAGDATTWLSTSGVDAITGLIDGLNTGIQDLQTFFTDTLPKAIHDFVVDAATWLIGTGVDILGGLVSGLTQGTVTLGTFLVQLPNIIGQSVIGAVTWLVQTGIDIITGLYNGILVAAPAVANFFIQLPGNILTLLVDAGTWLINTGVSVVTGFVTGVINTVPNLLHEFGVLELKVLGAIGDAATWLVSKGNDLIQGFINGIVSFLTNIPGAMVKLFDSVSLGVGHTIDWLVQAGKDLIQGFINGIISRAFSAGGVLDTLKNAIVAPANQIEGILGIHSPSTLTMGWGSDFVEGFQIGLESQYKNVSKSLTGFAEGLHDQFDPTVPLPTLTANGESIFAGVGSAGAATGTTVALNFEPGSIVVSGVSAQEAQSIGAQLVDGAEQRLRERQLAILAQVR